MIIEIANHPVTEILAIITFVIYVFLAARANIWCWAAGFLTSFFYTFVFLGVHVTSQLFLNILYMLMSVWGWTHWTLKRKPENKSLFNFTPIRQQLGMMPMLFLVVALCMLFLPSVFLNAHPFIDASITVLSLYATVLTIHRRIESWLYWVVLNASNGVIYWEGELTFTPVLYGVMSIVAIYGYLNWKKIRKRDLAEAHVSC